MSGNHTKGDLKQMQSLPLEQKILLTKRRIKEWYDHWNGNVVVSFSGGKDSTVLKHIVDSMYSDVPALFVNTGLEYPEIQRFAISFNSTYIVFTPSDGKSGYTYRITPRCGAGTASASSTNLTNRIPSVKGKHFKLYKSGNRFCIKRNEPMEG